MTWIQSWMEPTWCKNSSNFCKSSSDHTCVHMPTYVHIHTYYINKCKNLKITLKYHLNLLFLQLKALTQLAVLMYSMTVEFVHTSSNHTLFICGQLIWHSTPSLRLGYVANLYLNFIPFKNKSCSILCTHHISPFIFRWTFLAIPIFNFFEQCCPEHW